MTASAWQRSSCCAQGEACPSVAVARGARGKGIRVAGSAGPARTTLATGPVTGATFLRSVKESDSDD
ncbi:DUF397 domain-containing protein [Streptomyces sp. NPDC093085]|uniref:DUF397 domain-containing protein n=1 Tax=Streptomyces sp. NPDC093085 TaxID=3155068 RepID=UPI003421BFF9